MKTIKITLTDLEWQAMADIVVDPEVWARRAVEGKVHKCVAAVVSKEQTRLIQGTRKTMPATIEGILESHFAQPDYKTRAERRVREQQALLPPEANSE